MRNKSRQRRELPDLRRQARQLDCRRGSTPLAHSSARSPPAQLQSGQTLPSRAPPPGRFPWSPLPNPPDARPPATSPAVQGTSHAMSGALRRHPRRRMIASRHPSTAPEARDCPTRRASRRVLVQPSLNHVSHRPDRHHLRAAQGATRERVLGSVALKVRQEWRSSRTCAPSRPQTPGRGTWFA